MSVTSEPLHPAIEEIKNQFARHFRQNAGSAFQADEAASAAFSRLARELEQKRQTGTLSSAETKWQAAVDDLIERIVRYNSQLAAPEDVSPKIYNLGKQQFVTEPPEQPSLVQPKISETEAEHIISGFEKQFEEKVMNKIREQKSESADSDTGSGRSLQDYLSSIKADLPEEPFGDHDSQFDLSKLAHKNV